MERPVPTRVKAHSGGLALNHAAIYGLVTGGLLGGAMALSTVSPSVGVTLLANILFLTSGLASIVSLVALAADHLAALADQNALSRSSKDPTSRRNPRRTHAVAP